MYSCNKITAMEAKKLGLVNKVNPSEELIPFSREQALRIISPKSPSVAINLMKKIIYNYFRDIIVKTLDLENENNQQITKTYDSREAIIDFFSKRLLKFKGK